MMDAARAFLTALVDQGEAHWLVMLGTTGSGKTMLARWVFNFVRRYACHYVCEQTGASLVHRYQWIDWRSFSDGLYGGIGFGLVEDICDDWFVVIDDMASDRDPSGLALGKLDRILNSRLGKWTAITCNLPLEKIGERLDVRIASRLMRGKNVVVEVETVDYAMR